jgi:hypothetical protein
MGEVRKDRCAGMCRLCLRLIVSDYGTAHIQTTNHPLGEALFFSGEDRTIC